MLHKPCSRSTNLKISIIRNSIGYL